MDKCHITGLLSVDMSKNAILNKVCCFLAFVQLLKAKTKNCSLTYVFHLIMPQKIQKYKTNNIQ